MLTARDTLAAWRRNFHARLDAERVLGDVHMVLTREG